MTCLRCHERDAEPRTASVLQLCPPCLDDVFPGPDVERYMELRARYGYER